MTPRSHPDSAARPAGTQLSPSVARRVLEEFDHEIAQRLVISSKTAKTHVSRAMRKLGVDNRARLVALAYQIGFVRPVRLATGQSCGSPTHHGSRLS
jgi:Bacterial regulatory proteins, luxR family